MNRKFYVNFKNILCINIFRQISLILIFGIAVTASAAPGDLDTTFNGTGKSRIGFGGGDDLGNAVVVQSDGKPIVAGVSKDGSIEEFSVIRYNTDGTPDISFGSGGKVLLRVGSGDAAASAVKVQADGKIVVVGTSTPSITSNSDFTVLRFNADGSLDATFGAGGIVTTDFSAGSYDSANALALQADGKIVVAGSAYINDGSGSEFAVARYNTNGTLDTTFDADGKVTTGVTAYSDYGKAVVIQAGGKIVVAGNSDLNCRSIILVRYNANGSLDTTFDGDGKVIGSNICFGSALVIQPGNGIQQSPDKIVVAGNTLSTFFGSRNEIDVFRYNLDGSLDTTFDGDGKVVTTVADANVVANAVKIQGSGISQPRKIIVGGSIDFGAGTEVAVFQYNSNGSLDTTFDGDGRAEIPVGASSVGNAIEFSGKIVVAGSTLASSGNNDFAVIRLNTNGSTDGTFYDQGVRTDDIGNSDLTPARSTAIQTDGKIVVAGSTGFGQFAVVRYNTNGTLDTTFDADGIATTNIGTNSKDASNSVAIQPDGKIVAAGVSYTTTGFSFALVRYNSDGSLDTSFSFDGKVATVVGTGGGLLNALAIQPDGKIVVAGSGSNGSNNDFAVVRYNANGSLDTTFNGSGKVTTPIGAGNDVGNALAIQTDGKIVVAGYSFNGSYNDFAVVRYNTNGSLDTSFNSGGKATTPIGARDDAGNAIAIQSNGKIVLAGSSINNNGSDIDFAIVRYNVNGSLDASFGTGGKVTTAVGTSFDNCNAVTLQSNGKIVAAGSSIVGTNYNFAVVRYNTDGSLDNSYGTGGKKTIDVSAGAGDLAYGIALDSSGRAVVVGDAGGLFGIVRLLGDAPLSQTYEGDVQNRPLGDGFVDSDDIQQIRQFSVGSGLPYQSNEFQRADCSPRSTSGDGFVDGDDVQQARRFSVGTDGNQIAGGPTSIAPPAEDDWLGETLALPFGKQTTHTKDGIQAAPAAFRVDNQNTSAGATLMVPIRVDTVGNEAGYTFSIAFDSTKLTNPIVTIGSGGGDVVFNANNPGQIGFSVTSFSGGTIAAGNNIALVNVTFTAAAGAPAGTTPITFTDTPARRKASGVDPNNPIVQPTYTGGTITISGATAAGATIGGRVLTADGRGIRNAMVTMTNADGEARTVLSSAFGYFRFADIPAGQTYIIGAKSKRFKFAQATRVLNLSADVVDVNFIAVE